MPKISVQDAKEWVDKKHLVIKADGFLYASSDVHHLLGRQEFPGGGYQMLNRRFLEEGLGGMRNCNEVMDYVRANSPDAPKGLGLK